MNHLPSGHCLSRCTTRHPAMRTTFPRYPSDPRNPTSGVPVSRKLKWVTSARMEGTWDMKNRCFTVYAPPGIAEPFVQFQGVDGVHVLDSLSMSALVFMWIGMI